MEAFLFENPAWTPTEDQVVFLRRCLAVVTTVQGVIDHSMARNSGRTEALAHFCAGMLVYPPKGSFHVVVFGKNARFADRIRNSIINHTPKEAMYTKINNTLIQVGNTTITTLPFSRTAAFFGADIDLIIVDDADEATEEFLQSMPTRLIATEEFLKSMLTRLILVREKKVDVAVQSSLLEEGSNQSQTLYVTINIPKGKQTYTQMQLMQKLLASIPYGMDVRIV